MSASTAAITQKIGKFRWVICALLFFGVTKNYMDRQVLGLLKTTLQEHMHWDENDYANLVTAFQIAYAAGMVVMGRLIDRFGTRLGYAFSMVFWSMASMAHAAATNLVGFLFARAALGFGEAGVFPASIKTIAEWFPKKERSFATGIFNAGTNVGAILAPPLVATIVLHYNWRYAFLVIGAIGFVWLAVWLAIFRKPEEHPSVSPAELQYIQSDPPDKTETMPWLQLLPHRQTWAFVLAKGMTDPIWWFYLFWSPDFLQTAHHLKLGAASLPIMVIYLIGDVGSVAGGWIPTQFLKRGFSLNGARKLSMLLCAICVLPVILVPSVTGLWTAVFLIGLAAAAHQGFSANVFTLTSDMFPKRAIASMTGLGGMAGAIGGMLIAKVVGYVLQTTHSYRIPFLIAGGAYISGLAVAHALAPRLDPAEVDDVTAQALRRVRAACYAIVGCILGGAAGCAQYLFGSAHLTFVDVLTRGETLEVAKQAMRGTAEQAFNQLALGALIGAVLGLAIAAITGKKTPEE